MKEVGEICVEDEIFEAHFVCDLNKCKGACCNAEGGAGAPLTKEEIEILKAELPAISPYLTEEGREMLSRTGVAETYDGKHYTPTMYEKDCAFIAYDEKGIAKCGVEDAFNAGKTSFRKPMSCYLYPIRTKQYDFGDFQMEAIYYHKWSLCAPACELGQKLKVPVYQFLKQPLIAKYGEGWYAELLVAAAEKENDEK